MRAMALAAVPAGPEPVELPVPEPGPGEVLVRVAASSVNGFDVLTAGGWLQGVMEHRYPLVPGMDFAGTVEALGEGASRFAVGDAVFGVALKPFVGAGAFAEYVAVAEGFGVTAVPEGVPVEVAGALGLAGTAALDALAAAGPRPGETLLVVGATGGVGTIAVQYAVARGVRVIATARPGAEADLVAGLTGGRAELVDHGGDLAAQVRALAPEGVAAALHLAGDGNAVAGLVAPGGRLASPLYPAPTADGRDLTVTAVVASPVAATLDTLAADVAAGRITVPVMATYPLERVPEALAAFTAGTLGKIAITPA